MEETSGMVTEQGSLSQDGQPCNRCRMYKTAQQNHSLQISHTECLIQGDAVHSLDDFMLIKESLLWSKGNTHMVGIRARARS